MPKPPKQMSLPLDMSPLDTEALVVTNFSHQQVCAQNARLELEQHYAGLLQQTSDFDRKLVSFQGNKGQLLHSWLRYKEGFSAQLVEALIAEFGIQPGDTILEPFSGSGTTLLVAKILGIDALGIELLPVCHLAWDAKSLALEYDLNELCHVYELLQLVEPGTAEAAFPHITITETAFPPENENDLMFYTQWATRLEVSQATKVVLRLALTSILETVSFTRKDGQYLRWDSRSDKVAQRNRARIASGQPPFKTVLSKGEIPRVKTALVGALRTIIEDVRAIQAGSLMPSHQTLLKGSTLEILPTLEANQFAGVITSPPYCNRYDYTRTYALELAYLGAGEDGIRQLRQSQLSCTVEHRSKIEALRHHYQALSAETRFDQILHTIQFHPVFQEINAALQVRLARGEINNPGVLPMVAGYFIELTFAVAEILRTCRHGALVALVNDNVRYAGEIIPVDLLMTDLAVRLGFEPVRVYVLAQRKGNSSQQMGRFGREALRKSITIWRKR